MPKPQRDGFLSDPRLPVRIKQSGVGGAGGVGVEHPDLNMARLPRCNRASTLRAAAPGPTHAAEMPRVEADSFLPEVRVHETIQYTNMAVAQKTEISIWLALVSGNMDQNLRCAPPL